MAGATVSAVITARNYLAQFTAQEGYKIAISLVNDELIKIKDISTLLVSYDELRKVIDDNSHFAPRRNHLNILKPYISNLQNKKIFFDKSVHEIKLKIKKLHTYGLEISKSKQNFLMVLFFPVTRS